jgi:chorismate mutase
VEENKNINLCNNEEEAKELLQKSRKRIDEIDNDLINLIDERTALAKDVVTAKKFLGMEIYDKSREDEVHNQVLKLAKEKDIDGDILSVIMNMLAMLSKNKQKELLWREDDG